MDATTGETTQAVGAIRDLWRNGRVLGAAIAHGSQPTLRRRVDRIVRAHVKQNAAFKDLRYSGVRAALASLRQHPRVALFIVGLIYGAAILTAAVVPAPDWAPDVRSGVSDAYRDMLTVNVRAARRSGDAARSGLSLGDRLGGGVVRGALHTRWAAANLLP